MERPYSRLMHSFSIIGDLLKITFLTRGHGQRLNFKRVLDPELWCLIIIALLITTYSSAQNSSIIAYCPKDVALECGDLMDPIYIGRPYLLGAGIDHMVYKDDLVSYCPTRIVRNWTLIDDMGLRRTCVQNITVHDTLKPLFTSYPEDTEVFSDQIPLPGLLQVVDNCKNDQWIDFEEKTTQSIVGQYEIVRSWQAEDDCKNIGYHVQRITVIDTIAPSIYFNPIDTLTIYTRPPDTKSLVWAIDDNDVFVPVHFSDISLPGDVEGYSFLERTWWAEDLAGNVGRKIQTIKMSEDGGSIFSELPNDTTVECDAIPPAQVIFALDEPANIELLVAKERVLLGDCTNQYKLERTWSMRQTDGHLMTHVQTISVIDTTAPQIILVGESRDLVFQCSDPIPPRPNAIGLDNSGGETSVEEFESVIPGNGPNEWVVYRKWTATDDCGNSSTVEQTIQILDTVPPRFTFIPKDETVSSVDEILPIAAGAYDECDNDPSIMYEDRRVNGSCSGSFTIVRSWIAKDASGNSAIRTQNIQVIDSAPPLLFNIPDHVTVNCKNIPAPNSVEAIDNFDGQVLVEMEETAFPGICESDNILIRTWKAKDDCGNSMFSEQWITIIDTTAPKLIGVPLDTVFFDDKIPLMDENIISVDDCSGLSPISYSEEIIEQYGSGAYQLVRSWSTHDDCGNESTHKQVVTVSNSEYDLKMNGLADKLSSKIEAFPNPFSEETMIRFILPDASEALLEVFDMRGRIVEVLFDGRAAANVPVAREFRPQEHSSGSYIYRLSAKNEVLYGMLVVTR